MAKNLANVPGHEKMLQPLAWAERSIFFLQGFIRYTDSFGEHYITGFMACFSPEGGTWIMRGYEHYNYTGVRGRRKSRPTRTIRQP
jgi:hypothetical protein